jgi:Tfp pilus assembly protein PilV
MQGIVQLGRRTHCSAPGRDSGQAGFSLLEIIIAVMLVSMVVLSLATGFLTLVRTNRMTYEQQQVDHATTNYAESLKSVVYLPCGPSGTPDYGSDASLWTPPPEVQVSVVDVKYWDASTGDYESTCPNGDTGAQLLTIRAEFRDRERQAQIVKRSR